MPGNVSDTILDIYSDEALRRHKAVVWPIILDGQPFSWVDDPGTNILFRTLSPDYKLCSAAFDLWLEWCRTIICFIYSAGSWTCIVAQLSILFTRRYILH